MYQLHSINSEKNEHDFVRLFFMDLDFSKNLQLFESVVIVYLAANDAVIFY